MGLYRVKVQQLSHGTFIITIPKPIAREWELKKGDILNIRERSNKMIFEKEMI